MRAQASGALATKGHQSGIIAILIITILITNLITCIIIPTIIIIILIITIVIIITIVTILIIAMAPRRLRRSSHGHCRGRCGVAPTWQDFRPCMQEPSPSSVTAFTTQRAT